MKKADFVVVVMVLSFVFLSCHGVYGNLVKVSPRENVTVALIIAVVAGIIVALLGKLAVFIWSEIKYSPLNKFWRPLKGKYISIVLSEYEMMGNIENIEVMKKIFEDSLFHKEISGLIEPLLKYIKISNIAGKAANGFLVSKGNAKALSNLMKYLPKYVTNTEKILVDGDKSRYEYHKDFVIIGSPMTNNYAKTIFSTLNTRYHMPFEIRYSEDTGEIMFIYNKEGTEFKPTINTHNASGCDYAMIINAKYQEALGNRENRNVILLAGTYMYGTEAASRVVTNIKVFKTIGQYVKEMSNCVFLIKVEIINGVLQEPQLRINNRYYIFPLDVKN
jgi:hypothetical protein